MFSHVIGCAESWSLRVCGQAFANDVVCVSCLVMSLAALNPGACGYLGRHFMFGHVIGCAESWSLRVSGQAFANDVCVSCLVISLAALNAGACGYLGRRLLMMSSVFHVWSCHWLR